MYLLFITFCLIITHALLRLVLPFLLMQKCKAIGLEFLRSMITIGITSILGLVLAGMIPDLETSNRILHAFGGGFMAVLVCFLAMTDAQLRTSGVRFALYALLIASTLGVANELLEFVLQQHMGYLFAVHVNDTWLDLVSNTIGISIGIACFAPFIRKPKDSLSTQ